MSVLDDVRMYDHHLVCHQFSEDCGARYAWQDEHLEMSVYARTLLIKHGWVELGRGRWVCEIHALMR